jgi:hypothetical protein
MLKQVNHRQIIEAVYTYGITAASAISGFV